MNTPQRATTPPATQRRYTAKEKQQLVDNLDIEVDDRTRRFHDMLLDVLSRFRSHQEALITRLPKAVRNITMAEFGQLYNGDVQSCLRGLQRERLGDEPEPVSPAIRKRKWQESQESTPDTTRRSKAPRPTPSPLKKLVTPNHHFSSMQGRPLFSSNIKNQVPFPSSRNLERKATRKPNSPLKQSWGHQASRAPSLAAFNPNLPTTPAYPRRPRRHESLMSVNGSPLANPLDEEDPVDQATKVNTLFNGVGQQKRASSILIRRGTQAFPPKQSRPNTRQMPGAAPLAAPGTTVETQGFISVPTRDGRVIEFDPFSTNPADLDALEGVTNSAKKLAKEDAMNFINSRMAQWSIAR